jgi:hypothetical protein
MEIRRHIVALIRRGSQKSPAVAAAMDAIRQVARERAEASAYAGVMVE